MRKPNHENRTPAGHRPIKITFGDMRDMGVRGVLVYCADYRCSHLVALSADRWSDDVRLSDVEPRFVCRACGRRGADVRPDFNWNKPIVPAMGYR
ncbi:hypothetical protein QA640_24040 [Bradyrhizobium sp. CB82]|uniref:hypothetical protein n=1 Tax=Bradyrhizobium sp. CB82 TaxID=3039159 RepID=UPI0024B25BED|nr:hypothetical protein [Bradyrhizobium sp. CB82]WFU37547.1 hypothetical protein QA640_24040 [Bradyrhizobium sp. CB82]